MQIVIDIDEDTYKARQHWVANQKRMVDEVDIAIANGTPLPKGHGRIADIDEMIACIKDVEGEDASWGLALIEWAGEKRTIIEADRSEKTRQMKKQKQDGSVARCATRRDAKEELMTAT